MTSYLPQYNPPGYDAVTGLNTGDLGFTHNLGQQKYFRNPNMLEQVEVGGGIPGFLDLFKDYDPVKNPDAYIYDPFRQTPTKITYGLSENWNPSEATQWVNGQQVGINGNNWGVGKSTAPKPFEATAPSVGQRTMEYAPEKQGFTFGQEGQNGYRFMPGSFDAGKFFMNQPDSLNPPPNKNLGVLQPWQNPALDALKQYRSQP